MRSQWVDDEIMHLILSALMPENRLACEISMATGLRIGDVLKLKPSDVVPTKTRFTIKEEKTGKRRTVYLPKDLRRRAFQIAGRYYVFEHRLDRTKHRTRQAVFKDLRRACTLLRIKENITPHSARKSFSVNYFKRHNMDIGKLQNLLNHSNEAVTYIYAMADCLTAKRKKR